MAYLPIEWNTVVEFALDPSEDGAAGEHHVRDIVGTADIASPAPFALDEPAGLLAERYGSPEKPISGRIVQVVRDARLEEFDRLALLLDGPQGVGALALFRVEIGIARSEPRFIVVHTLDSFLWLSFMLPSTVRGGDGNARR